MAVAVGWCWVAQRQSAGKPARCCRCRCRLCCWICGQPAPLHKEEHACLQACQPAHPPDRPPDRLPCLPSSLPVPMGICLQGVPTEREVLTTEQGLPVYRVMLRRI